MGNLKVYNTYKAVPKEALKDFNNGSFKGSDINTMWRIKSLTTEFGVCGIGWYTELIRQWSEQAPNNEVLCFVEIKMYIKVDGEWGKGFSAIGGSKVVQYFQQKDYAKGNDEGYKMAYTDALGVACKYLGFGADVYWANDKTKYTNEHEEYKPKQKKEEPKTKFESMNIDQIKAHASAVVKKAIENEEIGEAVIGDIYYTGKKLGLTDKQVEETIYKKTEKEIRDLTVKEANEILGAMEAKIGVQ